MLEQFSHGRNEEEKRKTCAKLCAEQEEKVACTQKRKECAFVKRFWFATKTYFRIDCHREMLEDVFCKPQYRASCRPCRQLLLERACPGKLDPETHYKVMVEAAKHVEAHGRERSCLDVCGERGDLFWVIKHYSLFFQLKSK